jgi:photosystem II stability/assembly factor-like uncharacterized protein
MACGHNRDYFGQDLVVVGVLQEAVPQPNVILYKATDAGWHQLPAPQGTELRVTPDKTLYIFNMDNRQIYRSTDLGETWAWVAATPVFTDSQSWDFYPSPVPDLFLLSVIHEPLGDPGQQGIYKSADGGATWKLVQAGNSYDVAISPNFAQDGIAFASFRSYKFSLGILKTTDWGETWRLSSNGLLVGMDWLGYNIAISPQFAQDQAVFAASGLGIYKSTDQGESWSMLFSPDDMRRMPHDLALSPDYLHDQTLVMWGEWQHLWNDPDGVRLSRDGGYSWQTLVKPAEGEDIWNVGLRYPGPFAAPKAPPPPGSHRIYLPWVGQSAETRFEFWYASDNYYDGICYYYHSTDDGTTWEKLFVFEASQWLYLPLVSRN